MTQILGDTLGWLYILCFSRPIGNPANRRALASHYLGFALDVPARVATHAAGHGQALTAAAVAQGITWQVFYRPGTPGLERWLKAHYKNTPCICPRCAASRGRKPVYGFQPLDQLAMDFNAVEPWPEGFEFPALPASKRGWSEIQAERSARVIRFDNGDLDGDIPF